MTKALSAFTVLKHIRGTMKTKKPHSSNTRNCSFLLLPRIHDLVCHPYYIWHIHHPSGGTRCRDSGAPWQRNGPWDYTVFVHALVCVERDVGISRKRIKDNSECLRLYLSAYIYMLICPLFSVGSEDITACDWFVYTNLWSQHFCLLWCTVVMIWGLSCALIPY